MFWYDKISLNLFFVVIGSVFPDIDTPYSLLGKYNPFAKMMKHRGITHTPFMALLLSSLLLPLKMDYGFAFLFGYTLHLLTDYLTPTGIMWAYPCKQKYYTLSKKGMNLRGVEGLVFGISILYLFTVKIL